MNTFQQLCDVEQATERAVRAVRMLGSMELIRDMERLSGIIQEVRHAGQTLCDPTAQQYHEAATKRLLAAVFSKGA